MSETITTLPEPIEGGADVGCSTCAFRANSPTRHEPYNTVRAMVCEIGGVPFYCHYDRAGRDFHDSPVKPTHPSELRVCEGWKAAVREQAKTPGFRRQRKVQHAIATETLQAIEALTDSNSDDRDRKEMRGVAEKNMKLLARIRKGRPARKLR